MGTLIKRFRKGEKSPFFFLYSLKLPVITGSAFFCALWISCYNVRDPAVNPYANFCSPASFFFGDASSCPSAPRMDSNGVFVLDGFGGHDTVMIYVQGGPVGQLMPSYANFYEQFLDVAYVHQPQTLQGFKYEDFNTPDAWQGADADISKSAGLLNDAVSYFEDKGKTTIVLGASWGGFVIQQWLAEYNNIADKVFILESRLNAMGVISTSYAPAFPLEVRQYLAGEANKDYRPLLENRFLGNVIYITANNDGIVYPLTGEEKSWLQAHGVPLFVLNGFHGTGHGRTGVSLIIDLIFRQ